MTAQAQYPGLREATVASRAAAARRARVKERVHRDYQRWVREDAVRYRRYVEAKGTPEEASARAAWRRYAARMPNVKGW